MKIEKTLAWCLEEIGENSINYYSFENGIARIDRFIKYNEFGISLIIIIIK